MYFNNKYLFFQILLVSLSKFYEMEIIYNRNRERERERILKYLKNTHQKKEKKEELFNKYKQAYVM